MADASFFFSSRRRHTRYIGDWSSDVCSSDLRKFLNAAALELHHDDEFFRGTDGDAKLGIFELAYGFGERIDSDAQTVFLKAVTHLVKIKDAAVHRAAATLW